MELKELLYVGEFLKDRLYFATLPDGVIPPPQRKYYFFNVDNELVYENFYCDFGPLNLSMLYRYCIKLSKILNTFSTRIVVHCTSTNEQKRSNAAFLIASFAIIYLKKTVEEAYRPLVGKNIPSFVPFRDATTFTIPYYPITLKDCLVAIHRAHTLGFFRFNDFNLADYEHYEKVEEGDMNWIVPQKFLAFSSPHSRVDKTNSQEHAPECYFSYFKSNGITNIIRLNEKSYDASRFVDSGFKHNDLYFFDGGIPSDNILRRFFEITENAKGAIAVHCKAGLGRTGSVIACYLMKHYRFNVDEAIAWVRICRPGSIIGIQQNWLHEKRSQLWLEGSGYRKIKYKDPNKIPTHKYGIYSNEIRKQRCVPEDKLQGEFLYEYSPKVKLKDAMNRLGKINLGDNDEVCRAKVRIHDQEKNKHDLNVPIPRNSRSRTNVTQGDRLCLIKAGRKQLRSSSTPLSPVQTTPKYKRPYKT